MAIYLYQQINTDGKIIFKQVGTTPLAGHNIIYNQWKKKGEPKNEGWHISFTDIESELIDKISPCNRPALLIDYDPGGEEEVVLLQVIDIYPYTYADRETGLIWWSPMMLKMKKVYYHKLTGPINPDQRQNLIITFDLHDHNEEFVEFLYVQGEKGGWSWGKTGRVNAALIPPEARKHFQKYF
jgi:hypothetical protein